LGGIGNDWENFVSIIFILSLLQKNWKIAKVFTFRGGFVRFFFRVETDESYTTLLKGYLIIDFLMTTKFEFNVEADWAHENNQWYMYHIDIILNLIYDTRHL
jgi:hypothetical protein